MLTMLIQGPETPGLDVDVYLRPLVDELKELWMNGVDTYDASSGETFRMHACLLWTIGDFPMYKSLSGWNMAGSDACPICYSTDMVYLRGGKDFGLETSHSYLGHRRYLPRDHPWRVGAQYVLDHFPLLGSAPTLSPPIGDDMLVELDRLRSQKPGKHPNNMRGWIRFRDHTRNWLKRSIFLELDYWSKLRLVHNIDAMQVEKSLCDNIIGTLLDMEGKSKDSERDRLDLCRLNRRSDLHLQISGTMLVKRLSCYSLPPEKRIEFCKFMKSLRFPDVCPVDIAKNVSCEKVNISGLEAHECHVILQRILPIAVHPHLPKDITTTFSELATFFQRLFAKAIPFDDFDKL